MGCAGGGGGWRVGIVCVARRGARVVCDTEGCTPASSSIKALTRLDLPAPLGAANETGVPEKWQHILRRNEVFQSAAARQQRELEERESKKRNKEKAAAAATAGAK